MLYLLLVLVFSSLSKKWWFFLLLGYGKLADKMYIIGSLLSDTECFMVPLESPQNSVICIGSIMLEL